MILIRSAEPADYPAIHEVNVLAFGREEEALLVEELRGLPGFKPELSLVAMSDG